jgi:heme A synthase
MYIPTLLSTILLLTTTALGNPVPSEDSALQARGSYTCGSQRYTTSDVQNAMGDGIRHRQNNQLPILPGGREYTGGAPGPDRVVFADSEKRPGAYVQCFVMTHVGGLYKKCT